MEVSINAPLLNLVSTLISQFRDGDHQSVISTWTSSSLISTLEPIAAKIVASSYFSLGNYQEAFNLLVEIESCFDEDESYYSLFGVTCRRLGDFHRSEPLLSKALKLSPESLATKNNYANLLIDLNRFDESLLLLDEILGIDPNFSDAITNKNRLLDSLEKVKLSQSFVESACQSAWSLADPLLMAFTKDEVQRTTSKLTPKVLDKNESTLLKNIPNPTSHELHRDQLKMAEQAVLSKNFDLALKTCTAIYGNCQSDLIGDVYEIAADAYIGLKLFHYAEICYGCAANLKGYSFKHLFNLANLACLRHDVILARSYAIRARDLDSDNPSLIKLIDNLSTKSPQFAFATDWPSVNIVD